MTWMQYVIKSGACTTGELMHASKADPSLKETLKKWAIEEMKNKGIPCDSE